MKRHVRAATAGRSDRGAGNDSLPSALWIEDDRPGTASWAAACLAKDQGRFDRIGSNSAGVGGVAGAEKELTASLFGGWKNAEHFVVDSATAIPRTLTIG